MEWNSLDAKTCYFVINRHICLSIRLSSSGFVLSTTFIDLQKCPCRMRADHYIRIMWKVNFVVSLATPLSNGCHTRVPRRETGFIPSRVSLVSTINLI